jgi:hypothetical protein
MLSWRLAHAERTLTHFRATPRGLEERASRPGQALDIAAQ